MSGSASDEEDGLDVDQDELTDIVDDAMSLPGDDDSWEDIEVEEEQGGN